MRASDFTATAPGRLVPVNLNGRESLAFVPDPLPPAALRLGPATLRRLDDAEEALSQFAEAAGALRLAHPGLLRAFLRREAAFSSLSRTPEAEITPSLLEPSPSWKLRGVERREVDDYLAALDAGSERLKALPIGLQFVRELHQRLVRARGGELRDYQMHLGDPRLPFDTASLVVPPADEMRKGLGALSRFMRARDGLPFLVKLAVIKYQIEVLHPFSDGNGRLGRALLPLLLCERGYLSEPALYLSVHFYRHRAPYADLMLSVCQRGTWTEWIDFFLDGLIEQALDGVRRVTRLLDVRRRYQQACGGAIGLLRAVDCALTYPALTLEDARHWLKVSRGEARRALRGLCAVGVLTEVSRHPYRRWLRLPRRAGAQRDVGYVAGDLVEVLQAAWA